MSDGRFKPGNKKGIREGSPYRRPDGTMLPGHTANPGGPPKGLRARIREEFSNDVPAILRVFRDLALGRVPAGYGDSEIKTSDRIKAGTEVIERVDGKARQQVTVDDKTPARVIDVTNLSDAQLEALAAIDFVVAEPEPDVTEH